MKELKIVIIDTSALLDALQFQDSPQRSPALNKFITTFLSDKNTLIMLNCVFEELVSLKKWLESQKIDKSFLKKHRQNTLLEAWKRYNKSPLIPSNISQIIESNKLFYKKDEWQNSLVKVIEYISPYQNTEILL